MRIPSSQCNLTAHKSLYGQKMCWPEKQTNIDYTYLASYINKHVLLMMAIER